MHHRPSRIRRRSSSLSAILVDSSTAGLDSTGHLTDSSASIRRCRAPNSQESKRHKKRCRVWGSREPSPTKLKGEASCSTLQPTQLTAPFAASPSTYTFPTSTALFGLAPSGSSAAPPRLPPSCSPTAARRDSSDTHSSLSTTPPSTRFSFADEPSSSPTSSVHSTSSSYKRSLPTFTLRPLCGEMDMELDPPPPTAYTSNEAQPPPEATLEELSRLHHLAFESLRSSTFTTEEDFLCRLRRWEAEKLAMAERGLSVSPPAVHEGVRGLPCSPEQGVAATTASALEGAGTRCEDDAMREAAESGDEDQADDEEEEVAFILSPSSPAVQPHALSSPIRMPTTRTKPPLRRSDTLEVEELSRKLRGGAMALEDFGALRDWQAEQQRGRQAR